MSQCKLASKDATKQELLDNHKVKMGVKKNLRAARYDRQQYDPSYVQANLSVDHPDYGMSPAEHEAEKQARQKSS